MIYLDHAATTACAAEVVDAMVPYFRDSFANASSIDHMPGSLARKAIDEARADVAALVGAKPEDVIFTSGSTEANNLALSVDSPVLTTAVEHPSILDTFQSRNGAQDAFVVVDGSGRVDAVDLTSKLMGRSGALVSVIATNNETGVEQNVSDLSEIVHGAGAMLHFDATQAVGTAFLDMKRVAGLMGLSISAHKIYGPKGVGALIATGTFRKKLSPIVRGGGHERGLRSGTLNVPGIVGFAVAARMASAQRNERRIHLKNLREVFLAEMRSTLGDTVTETIASGPVSPHVLSLRLKGTSGRALLRAVREEVAFSLGSACATNKAEPSHVLLALGLDKKAIAETIRISFSAEQRPEEVRQAAATLAEAAKALSIYSLSA